MKDNDVRFNQIDKWSLSGRGQIIATEGVTAREVPSADRIDLRGILEKQPNRRPPFFYTAAFVITNCSIAAWTVADPHESVAFGQFIRLEHNWFQIEIESWRH